jgi:hypothetical protein
MSEAELFIFGHPIPGWLLVDLISRGTTSLPGRGGGEDEDRRQTAEEFHVAIGSSRGQVFGHFHADGNVEGSPVSERIPFEIELQYGNLLLLPAKTKRGIGVFKSKRPLIVRGGDRHNWAFSWGWTALERCLG